MPFHAGPPPKKKKKTYGLPSPPLLRRWPDGPQSEDAEHVQGATWRRVYLERDAHAVLEARATAPSEELLPIYVQVRDWRAAGPSCPAAPGCNSSAVGWWGG